MGDGSTNDPATALGSGGSLAGAAAVELSGPSIGRLSLYFRELHQFAAGESGHINSHQLGGLVNVSPAVVRRDLSDLGATGRRGVGYSVASLIDRIGNVLGSGTKWRVILVGVGSLGDALLRYRGFQRLGFELSGAFDNSPRRVGQTIAGVKIRDIETLETFLVDKPAELSILAVPADQALELASRLVGCGIHGILNFAPTTLKLPPRVAVVNVDLASELQGLAFKVQSLK